MAQNLDAIDGVREPQHMQSGQPFWRRGIDRTGGTYFWASFCARCGQPFEVWTSRDPPTTLNRRCPRPACQAIGA